MMAFWILAALLAVVAAAALLPALLRRRPPQAADAGDEAVIGVFRERLAELERERGLGRLSDDGFAEARAELERELLADFTPGHGQATADDAGARPTAAALAVLVPLAALLLYAATGAPERLGTSVADQLSPAQVERYRAMEPERRIEALEPFVAEHPRSPWGWSLLANGYHEAERYGEAVTAYARAREHGADGDAWIVAQQAEALLLANDRRFGSGVRRLIDQALERDERNPLALMLAGHDAFAEGDRQRAATYWQRLAETMPPQDEQRALIEDLVARARGTAGQEAEASAGQETRQSAAADARVTARVRLHDALRERTWPEATVFVFARRAGAAGGPPLAVARTTVGALPAEITLSDADAMSPQATLSQAREVVVTARVSLGGDVMAKSGDLEGRSEAIAVNGGSPVEVVIDQLIE